MAGIYEHVIHRFLRERGGKASKQEIFEALGSDEESRRTIEEKVMMMRRMGIVVVDGDVIRIK